MEIHVQRGEERIGPLSPEQVRESLSNGNFQGNELAWHSGLSDWVSVSTVLDTLPNAGNTTAQIQQHTFNVTGCVFTIQPRQTEIRQGDTIGFDVTVTCGEKRVIADEIYISLMESKTGRVGNRSVNHYNRDKKILASNITMEAGESHSFEFITKLPDDCVLSDGQEITGNPFTGATDGWCLYMHVENDEYRASGYGKADAVAQTSVGVIARFLDAIGKLVGNDRIGEKIGEKMEGRVIRRDPRSCFFLTIKSR